MKHLAIGLSLSLVSSPLLSQGTKPDDSMKNCPMHAQHTAEQAHHAIVSSNGDQAMGFRQDKTTHHFHLMSDGGVIHVTVNDPNDNSNTDAIRTHLSHVTMMFSNGDFSIPMYVHDGVPPGVTTMKLMKSAIHYTYEEMPSGGRIRIKSDDPIAVAAIHDFVRFQITDHRTGDTLEVECNNSPL
jgi:hypothetical protein